MTKTAVALYDTKNDARQVKEELANTGYNRSNIHMMSQGDGENRSLLINSGLPRSDAEAYVEGVRRGGNLVMVTTEDSRIDSAVDIMERHNSINIHERANLWRNDGWEGTVPAQAGTQHRQDGAGEHRTRGQEEETIPVVEEEMRVGKRQVERGGVRIHTNVEEQPVEETVTLRDEEVHVDRRPANRKARPDEMDTFEEGTFEVSEMDEEAVVDKQARVVEEVVVSKDVEEHQEQVRDTVRHTDVDVEEVDDSGSTTERR
ncbi:MAG: YsnF/AvaK domain-containing protein [Caldilineaceae bacterium]|nr:YsnF/AvaK domain-containing protein [Caldilineaceae bacterium]